MKSKIEQNFNPASITVLVVDDLPQMRKAMKRVLSTLEFTTILEAGNGSDAIKILKETPVDLVICDLYLFDISGIDVLEYVRNRDVSSNIPFLVVTGEASKEEIVKAADRGANDYLLKPFKAEDLESKIIQLLNSYLNPSEALKMLRIAERFYLQKSLSKALDLTERVLAIDPMLVSARNLKALILHQNGDSELALKIYQQIAEINPNYYRCFAGMAEIYLSKRKIPQAIEAIEKELNLNPKQAKRQTQLGTLLLESGDFEKAIKHFREALKENIKYLYALFGMGRAYAKLSNLEKAIYYFKRVRRYYPTNTKALEAIVKYCLEAKDPKKAEWTLRDEKNSYKSRLDTYIVLARFYLATDSKDKALQTVDELMALDANNIQGMKLKGAIHLHYKEIEPAIKCFDQILALVKDAETHMNYGDALGVLGRHAEALKHLRSAIECGAPSAAILPRLATCYYKSGEILKTIYTLERLSKEVQLNDNLKTTLLECKKLAMPLNPSANKQLAS